LGGIALSMNRTRLPPGPKSLIPGRLLFEMIRNPLGFLENAARTYGDVVYFKLGFRSHCLLTQPGDIKDVMITRSGSFTIGYVLQKARVVMGNGLVNSEMPLHARQRRMVQRSFNKQRLAGYAQTMVAHALRQSAAWRDGETRDIDLDMTRLTQNIVMKTLFNVEAGAEADALARQFKVIMDNSLLFYALPYPELLLRLPIPRLRTIVRAMEHLDRTIYGIVSERRRSGKHEGDLLSDFIAARDIEGDGGAMTDRQVRDECVSAFAAAHETTSSALAWAFYLLARHPAVEEQLHREITSICDDRAPAFEDYGRLPYAKAVLSEAMRLYPPAWHMSRRALEDYDVGGYTIPAGAIVMMNSWLMHRDARFFPEPERFDPGRFMPGAASGPAFSYFPFGGGARGCVGEGFAWLSGVLTLAVLVRDWTLRLTHDRPIEPHPLMTLRPKGGLPMVLQRRHAR